MNTQELLINLALKKQHDIILSFNTKISLNDVVLLKSDIIEKLADNNFYERLKKLGIADTKSFLKKFKKDCNIYMLAEDSITVNSYLNFLEAIK